MPDAKKRLVVIGNGMAGGRFVEEMLAREGFRSAQAAGPEYEITVFGEEPCGNYNRILLSSVLAGHHKIDDIFINPVQWYDDHGVRFHRGVRAGWIDRISKSVYAAGGIIIKEDLACRNEADVYAIGECAEFQDQLCGLFAPLAQQARILADRLTGSNPDSTYQGFRVSTKLKVMGVDVAVMGDKEPLLHDDEVVHYSEPRRGNYKKLIVRGERLAGAILMGADVATAAVLQAFDRGELVPENRSELLFPATDEPQAKDIGQLPDAAQICNCNAVSKGAIFSAFQDGCRTFEQVSAATKAGTCCGACKSQVRAVLGWAESPASAEALAAAAN